MNKSMPSYARGDTMSAARVREEAILKQCRASGKKWVDPDFPQTAASICHSRRVLLKHYDHWERLVRAAARVRGLSAQKKPPFPRRRSTRPPPCCS